MATFTKPPALLNGRPASTEIFHYADDRGDSRPGVTLGPPSAFLTAPLWPSSAASGYFEANFLVTELLAAVAAQEDWCVWIAYDQLGAQQLASFGRTDATEGRLQHYAGTAGADLRTIVKTSGGANAHFQAWSGTPGNPGWALYEHKWGGSNYAVTQTTERGGGGISADAYFDTEVDAAMDTGAFGALVRNGGSEPGTSYLLGGFFCCNASISAGAKTALTNAFIGSGNLADQVSNSLAALENDVTSATKFSCSFNHGSSARVGSNVRKSGVLTYTTL